MVVVVAVGDRPRRQPSRGRPSTLVVSEVQTGGASASDEFVEIANQGTGPVDLAGLEVVYATASGSTVTRKATWTASTILEPGRRLLLANGGGSVAGIGDLTYTGGFAATGGAVALRVVGGAVIDSVGWGDADERVRRGIRGRRAAGRLEPRASARRRPPATASTRTTTPPTSGSRGAVATGDRRRRRSRERADPSPVPTPTPPTRRPTPTPTPTRHRRRRPTPTPTPDAGVDHRGRAVAAGRRARSPSKAC